MPKPALPRIAVLGAGPIGLEAALYARSLGLSVTVYERGRIGEHWQRWGHVRLFSPFGMNTTPLGRAAIRTIFPQHEFPADTECITGRQHVATYLEPLAMSSQIEDCVRTETHVLAVSRRGFLKGDSGDKRAGQPFRLLVRDSKKVERIDEADVVLDCTGVYGQHRWMGDGGIPALGELVAEPHLVYGLDDILGERRSAYAGKNILVVGGGYSAATTVSNLATLGEQQSDTWVIWLSRGTSTQPIRRITNDPLRERDRLAVRANTLATRTDGNVEFHNQTLIDAVEFLSADKGFRVSCRIAGKPRVWEVERVVGNVGFTPDGQLTRELQVHQCFATLAPMNIAAALAKHAGADSLTQPPQGSAALRNPEPNLYILGVKSYGRNPHFLLRTGFEQVRDVFTLVMGKAELDLYKAGR